MRIITGRDNLIACGRTASYVTSVCSSQLKV